MKKVLTGILALGLAAAMSLPTFAENSATNDGTAGTDIAVNGKFQAGAPEADVISVDLVWESMDFTYTAPSKGTWNAQTHQYDNPVAGGWAATNGTDPKITVTNHSNTAVKASFAFATDIAGLNGSFTSDSLVLATAENTELANAPKGETAFSVDGTAIDADKKLGTITITVANGVATVSNEEELIAAITAKAPVIKLENSISLSDCLEIDKYNGEINLNGFSIFRIGTTLTITIDNSTIIFKNGTLENSYTQALDIGINSNITLEKCTIRTSSDFAMYVTGGTAVLKDCTLSSEGTYKTMCVQAIGENYGSLTFSGKTTIASGDRGYAIEIEEGCSARCLPGTYNFDVSSYVDATLYDVTNDGTTWIVTAK